jgi:hypothetical protein
MNMQAIPPEPTPPWRILSDPSHRDPIIQFRADDRRWYGSQSNALSTVYDEMAHRLEVKAPPHGILVISGPGTAELRKHLSAHQVTDIRTDGSVILSVERMADPEDEEEAQAVAEAVLQGMHSD